MASPRERKSPGSTGTSPAVSTTTTKSGKKGTSPQGPPTLQEVKRRGHRARKTPERDICDQLEDLSLNRDTLVVGTGLVCDDRMTLPYCLWDAEFPECPARLQVVQEKLAQYGLVERCLSIPAREASEEELLLVHSSDFVQLMRSTEKMSEEELKELSDHYDSVYLHPASFATCCLSAGSVLQLVDKVVKGEIRNGLAVVRPPGHHAHADLMNGYCMFNQLAIAARYAQHNLGVKRVLIVDWDVHHGQGTQFIFEDDPSVLYFSIHRYEDGSFWPHLAESSSAAVGKERGERYNINVPWNKIEMKDADYISAFLHLLLPVAYEFQPQLVLVAAGFDSMVGDPKGEMAATPACFAHLTHLLMPLAEGRLILSLEGGYNLRSLAEGVCASLKVLLGDPCPNLPQPFAPCGSALGSISETICVHRKYWRNLQEQDFTLIHKDEAQVPAVSSATPGAEKSQDSLTTLLDAVMKEVMRKVPDQRTGLVYHEGMMEHFNMWDSCHPELPQRIARIYLRHKEMGLLDRCVRVPHRLATKEELQMCHNLRYIKKIESCSSMKPRDLHRIGEEYNSVYVHNKSYSSACLAAGSTFSVVEAVVTGKVQNGVAIVRPPGHHAEPGEACGFCFFNNAALAARYAQKLQSSSEPPLRVMILDWDIHHGNGTQHIFQEDNSVLYVSIHRYDNGLFFPSSEDAAHDKVGSGRGEGFNVNIPWNGRKMGDMEYLLAFHRIVMPIAYEFNPQLVLVSAGFDAARGDPLGGCRISPEGYAHMTHLLMGLASGKVVVILEGGYNLISISESMSMCTRTLLGDPPPFLLDLHPPRPSALRTISNVLSVQHKYWRSLRLKVEPPPPSDQPKEVYPSPQKMHPSKVISPAKSPSLPLPKMAYCRENIGNEQTLQPLDLTKSKDRDDKLTVPTPKTESLEIESPKVVTLKDESNDSISSIDIDTVICSGEKNVEVFSPEFHSQTMDNVAGFPLQKLKTDSRELDEHKNTQTVDKVAVFSPHSSDMSTTEKTDRLGVEEDMVGQISLHNCSSKDVSLSEDYVSEKTPNMQISEDNSSVEELMRDLKLEEPSGGAKRRTPPSRPAESTKEEVSGEMFTVTPLPWCPHLESINELPPCGLDVTQACAACGTDVENWVCLTCYAVLCGRYISQHMLSHAASSGHHLVLSFSGLSVWCYGCDAYIHNELLTPAKQSAYNSKFGETDGQNSEHGCSREGALPEPASEVSACSPAPMEVCRDGAEHSGEELTRGLKLDDSNHTSATCIENESAAGTRRKTLPSTVQGTASQPLNTQTEENRLSEAAGGCSASHYQLDMASSMELPGEMYTVTPLPWCPHLESVCELPPCGLDVSHPCAACGTSVENWVCLTCYVVLCGRYVSQHMMSHEASSGHHLVLSFSDLSVWCYGCDAYIHNEVLSPAKRSAYFSKFGEEMPGV
ncbi:histone deacetylase 6 isoform X3 [Hyperolius riggenbachi]|uniref:histone deacetylase 6 isoform X3 n=1 Tax=Hyperolius riggenbachi TaxID=752182 RepID=UPI0035A39077